MLWAALSMTAALVMTACSSDNDIVETPAAPQAKKTIPYTVTVSDDAATRATVSDDPTNRQLYFASGDQLYITGTDIQGVLDLQAGDEGKATGATFSGELTYSGSGSPADDLSLTATLVSAQQTVGTQVSVDAAGAVTVNYPTAAYCATISDAVQQYSNLTGTSTYGARAFTLTQQTAFLNFVITFEDGTATGETFSAVVSNGGAAVCTANVNTTTESEKVVAKFVLPVAAGTTLSSATVQMGGKEAISFGASQELAGKVYNVKKTQAAAAKTLAEATAGDIGKIAGADGNIYDTKADAETAGTTAVAMIAYVGSDTYDATFKNGLAIALADEVGSNWSTAMSTCSEKTAITGAKWCLPSQDQWKQMFKANGGNDEKYTGLNTTITTAGGTTLKVYYWSSSESSPGVSAVGVYLMSGSAMWGDAEEGSSLGVRACLAF